MHATLRDPSMARGSATERFARLEILDPQGKPHSFSELWQGSTAVLGFVRHFGCVFCHEQVSHLKAILPQIIARNASLKIIGNGNPDHATFFMRRFGLREGVYTDPARLVYEALGMRHGLGKTLGVSALKNGLRAYRSGFRNYGVQGDPWQQGGTVIVTRSGDIAYRFIAENAGDEASARDILRVLDGIR